MDASYLFSKSHNENFYKIFKKLAAPMRSLYEEKLVPIPKNVTVTLNDKIFTFEGPLGKQTYDVSKLLYTFDILDNNVRVRSWHGNRKKNDLLGTIAAHIKNHANGVVSGFKYVLKAAYRHFSINITVAKDGKSVTVKNFLGSNHVKVFPVRGDSKAVVGENKDLLIISGINLNDVSQTAAHISSTCAKQKKNDVRIFMDGIYVAERTSIVQ
ncbi:large subunit ribosomal protein L9e [Enteropsectra breve]|nr:large subunit ribosomal protein L9e [Enteropsectra breve]